MVPSFASSEPPMCGRAREEDETNTEDAKSWRKIGAVTSIHTSCAGQHGQAGHSVLQTYLPSKSNNRTLQPAQANKKKAHARTHTHTPRETGSGASGRRRRGFCEGGRCLFRTPPPRERQGRALWSWGRRGGREAEKHVARPARLNNARGGMMFFCGLCAAVGGRGASWNLVWIAVRTNDVGTEGGRLVGTDVEILLGQKKEGEQKG